MEESDLKPGVPRRCCRLPSCRHSALHGQLLVVLYGRPGTPSTLLRLQQDQSSAFHLLGAGRVSDGPSQHGGTAADCDNSRVALPDGVFAHHLLAARGLLLLIRKPCVLLFRAHLICIYCQTLAPFPLICPYPESLEDPSPPLHPDHQPSKKSPTCSTQDP